MIRGFLRYLHGQGYRVVHFGTGGLGRDERRDDPLIVVSGRGGAHTAPQD
ncbi:hypothetical protein ACVWZR_002145 [Bradyrhizobium sp. i1.3.1]